MIRLTIEPGKTLGETTDRILSAIRMDAETLVTIDPKTGAAVRITGGATGELSFWTERVARNGASLFTGNAVIVPSGYTNEQVRGTLYSTVKRSLKSARRISK